MERCHHCGKELNDNEVVYVALGLPSHPDRDDNIYPFCEEHVPDEAYNSEPDELLWEDPWDYH